MSDKSGQDLINEINELRKSLGDAQKEFYQRGQTAAEAEKAHDIAFALAILEEKGKGTPATLIEKLVKGKPDIADLKSKWNIAETLYKSADKAIDNYKKQLSILNTMLEKGLG